MADLSIEGVDCQERETRAAMTEMEFWASVAESIEGPGYQGDPEPDFDWDQTTSQADPCPECGERGACAYDAEGRALTHVSTRGDDDE